MTQNVVTTQLGMGGAAGAPQNALGQVSDALSFLEHVPATLLVFPSLKIPVPIPIPVQFKPEKYSVSKGAYWRTLHTGIQDAPSVKFAGGEPEKVRLDLFFDTTSSGMDVRFHTKPLQMLAYRNIILSEPPKVIFMWGTMMSKMSYVTDVDVEYTMFLPQGIPVRAEVKLSLTEYYMGFLSALPMNPTSISEARKTWLVIEGQTLDWIAYQEYGDPAAWRHIAKTNDLADPMNLRPGQLLNLTPLP